MMVFRSELRGFNALCGHYVGMLEWAFFGSNGGQGFKWGVVAMLIGIE